MLKFLSLRAYHAFSIGKKPMRVAVTGAAGQICYSMLFRIAHGDMLGENQPVILQLLDIPEAQRALSGVAMELRDCAFPLLQEIICTDDPNVAFKDAEAVILVGAKPSKKNKERRDFLQDNAEIFITQGRAINQHAHRDVRVLVVANPANTLCLLTATHAKDLPKENFCALTRLDHDRVLWKIAQKSGTLVKDIHKIVVWGNHAATMYPDLHWATIKGKPALEVLQKQWVENKFPIQIKQRWKQIFQARGHVSGSSAANAAIAHMRNWFLGQGPDWVSYGAWTNGNPYGIPEGLYFGMPVTVFFRQWRIVKGLKLTSEQQAKITITANDLIDERNEIKQLLKI